MTLVLAFALFLTPGCGSESAQVECEALLAAYCKIWARCTSAAETYDAQYALCKAQTSTAIACADARSVSASYDQCLMAIEALSCASPLEIASAALPTSCVGVVQLQ